MRLINFTTEEIIDLKLTGVYGILHMNKPSILYVGSTASSFADRWRKHLSSLRRKCHHSQYLQNVVNKYGINGLEFFIIDTCDKEIVLGIEQYWINQLQPEYNSCPTAGNSLGYTHRPEDIEKTSIKVCKYSLEGKFIEEFASINKAVKLTGILSIADCVSGRNTRAGQYMWKKSTGCYNDISCWENPKTKRPINCYTLDGKFYKTFESILQASTELSLETSSIVRNLNGRLKKCNGFIFKDFSEDAPITIDSYVKKHKLQKSLKITNLITGETTFVASFRQLSTIGIDRGYIQTKLKNADSFIHKKRNLKFELL